MELDELSTQQTQASHGGNATLNGLEPEALKAAVAAIAENPALAAVAFSARSTWQGRFRSRTQIESYELASSRVFRRHTIDSDEPEELFGTNTAPNPQDLLLASLNACMMVGFVVAATARGIELEALSVESSLALDLRGAFGIDPGISPGAQRIHYKIEVKGSATAEQFAEVHAEMIATSPNRFHLGTPIAFDAELIVR
jgi:uncharacterized OsmC-like protein